jgi:uncharacterized protein Usg
MEVGMVSRVGVSDDFRKQVLGYGLTTAQILYRMPDHPSLLQTYVWQNYDLFPKFPALKDFLAFWEEKLEGPLFSVTVAHSKLIKPAAARSRRRVPAAVIPNSVGVGEAKARPPILAAVHLVGTARVRLCPPCERQFVLTLFDNSARESTNGQAEAEIADRGQDRRAEKIAGAQARCRQDRRQDRRQIRHAKIDQGQG